MRPLTPQTPGRAPRGLALALVALAAGLACRQDMHDQPRYKAFAYTDFFCRPETSAQGECLDLRSARPLIPGTVPRGFLRADTSYYQGKQRGAFVTEFPVTVDLALVTRGRQRFEIYCTPCHGRVGDGDGMVVARGYRRPPSFHQDRLRAAKPGYLFDVVTNGFGAMPDYAAQVAVADRWAIVAYVRALQLSQYAAAADLTAEERVALEHGPAPEGASHHE